MTQSPLTGPDWRMRLFRVRAGLGSGVDAAVVETVLEGPEYLGPFGDRAAFAERQAAQNRFFAEVLAHRFGGEKVTLLQLTPLAQRQPYSWDKRG